MRFSKAKFAYFANTALYGKSAVVTLCTRAICSGPFAFMAPVANTVHMSSSTGYASAVPAW